MASQPDGSESKRRFTGGPRLSPLVGRDRELDRLTARLEAIDQRGGGLVLIAGEPGIGKTRLMDELARVASERGRLVLRGRAYESEGMPPYLPFIEALRAYATSTSKDDLARHAGGSGAEIGRLLPEIVPGALPSGDGTDPESERFRLLEAVTAFLLDAAAERGMLLCLDDLQWADRSTLFMLSHLARRLPNGRLLVAGTYRTVDLDRSHPLAEVLATLSRERLYERHLLGALTLEDAGSLVQAAAGVIPHADVARAIHRETNGNPFFLEEVVSHILAEGRRVDDPETAAGEWGIPESVKQVIGRRLARLSAEAIRLLQAAATLDGDFDLPVLERATGLDGVVITEAVEQALAAGLVREQDALGFSHPMVRETVYDEISLPRKQRLHLQIARAIEEVHSRRLSRHVSALAAHLRLAGAAADPSEAIRYSEEAAAGAGEVSAWDESVTHLEGALQVLELSGLEDGGLRAGLLEKLAGASGRAGDAATALEIAGQAFAIAEALGDSERAAGIALLALRTLRGTAGSGAAARPEFGLWASRADQHAGVEGVTRIYANVELFFTLGHQGRLRESLDLRRRTLSQARALGDADALVSVCRYHLVNPCPPDYEDERFALAKDFAANPPAARQPEMLAHAIRECGILQFRYGHRQAAEALFRRANEIASGDRYPALTVQGISLDARMAVVDGDFDRTRALVDRLLDDSLWRGQASLRRDHALGSLAMAAFAGDEASLHRFMGMRDEPVQAAPGVSTGLLLAIAGRAAEAHSCLVAGIASLENDEGPWTSTNELASLLQLALLLGDGGAASRIAQRLEPVSGLITGPIVGSLHPIMSIARLLGDAEMQAGRPEEARRHYARAMETCRGVGFRPEMALIRLHVAELLLSQIPARRSEGRENLDAAMADFEALGMQRHLRAALELRDRRGGGPAPAPRAHPDGLSTREVQVLRLIAEGKSNRDIAERLFISLNTVERHVNHIFAKTNVSNRVEAANYAHAHSLAAADTDGSSDAR